MGLPIFLRDVEQFDTLGSNQFKLIITRKHNKLDIRPPAMVYLKSLNPHPPTVGG
jgi:hypothetical protein